MTAFCRPDPSRDVDHLLSAQIMETACSVAQELSKNWPFSVARISVVLPADLARPDKRPVVGRALALGLSGVGAAAGEMQVMGVLALQRNMMAIRLAGRTLVAFHPDRDVTYRSEPPHDLAGRMHSSAWSVGGRFIGSAVRPLPSSLANRPG